MPGSESSSHARGGSFLAAIFDRPILWGAAATFGFYKALPLLPSHRELAERYFCGHPIEYATTALFFIGLALLARKTLGMMRQRRALAFVMAEAEERPADECHPRILYETLPSSWQPTVIGQRLFDASLGAEAKRSSGIGDHLKYLAELASERLHGSYALIRTVTWAIPILGFLGTVMGITLAIANINPAQLSSSLGDVTGGLGIAFDTTALALALSLVLVFATFLVERSEQSLLDSVEAFALRRIFANDSQASPLAEAEIHAASDLVERTDTLIQAQTAAWQSALEEMRNRWSETILQQQEHLRESLTAGMRMTLEDHSDGLKAAREELVGAVSECTDRLERTLSATNRERARQLEAFSADLRGLWDCCRGDLDDMQDRYATTLNETVTSVGRDLNAFREDLRQTNDIAHEQHRELARQGEQLVRIAESSGDLRTIEGRLTDNLQSLKTAETMQEAVHSLTAAAHLLTARSTIHSRAA